MDLHIHSKYSFDGLMSPKTILKNAEHKGLNALAVTDHNSISGGIQTLRISKETNSNIKVIVGAEIATNKGDLVGLFLNEEIKSRNFSDVVSEIRCQGGLAVLPHPFKGHKFSDLTYVASHVDMIEVLNSRTPIKRDQIQFLKTLNKTLLGSSDAHFPQEIGLCKSTLSIDNLTIDEIKQMLLVPSKIVPYGSFGTEFFQIFSRFVKVVKHTYN